MIKRLAGAIFLGGLTAVLSLAGCGENNSSVKMKTIGINQYMEHPLLEQAREGMMSELARQGITEQNGYKIGSSPEFVGSWPKIAFDRDTAGSSFSKVLNPA